MTIRAVAIVGTGVIGASWAAFFLANGFDVTATDPAPDAEARMRDQIARTWPDLVRIGLVPGASIDRLAFHAALPDALAGAGFVQESGPERLPLKQELYARMDALLPREVIIASSTSSLMMSDIQQGCARFPQRCVVAHPFNPPHILPLVELVGGRDTDPQALDDARAFFEGLGKKCIRLDREIFGHVANRIAWAMYREVVWLVEQGYVSVGDVDRAVTWGPGLRWAGMGPNILYHLGGGDGGIAQFLAHLGESMQAVWTAAAPPALTPELGRRIAAGIADEIGDTPIDTLCRERDAFLIDLVAQRQRASGLLSR